MRKLFNKRFVAMLLTLAMVLSLVPAFGSVEANAAIADDADVIRLPITIRDANQDNVLFENWNFNNKSRYIPTTIEHGVPQYNETAIQDVAELIANYRDYSTSNTDQNPYLYDALQKAMDNASNWSSNTTSGSDVTYLEDADSAYSAAKWMLSHLFVDGQYYADQPTAVGDFDASKNYTKTYPGYEELVLQKDTYRFSSGGRNYSFDCYSYKSKNARTNFVNGDDQIHNVTSGGSSYSNGGWFPLEERGFKQMTSESGGFGGGSTTKHNFHTTTAGNGQFVYHKADDLFFAFTGDDDVFLYINDILVINDGGIHGEEYSRVFLEQPISNATYRSNVYMPNGINTDQTWAEYLGLVEGQIYSFNFFQMERNRTDSNFAIYTNINVVDSSAVPQKRVYQNGQELIYGSFVPQNSEVTYGFELTNNGGENGSPIKDLTFVDAMLGVNLNKETPVIDNDDATVTTYADLEYAIYKIGETPVYTKLTNETGAETLKSLLAAGIESGYTFAIRGFKYNVGAPAAGATTKTISNTVQTTAVGTANNSADEKVLRGNASVRIRTWDIANKTFVMDYAKTMNLTNEQVFDNELNELSKGISVEEVIGSDTVKTTATLEDKINSVSLDKTAGIYGNMELTGSSISDYGLAYTPTRFISGMDSFIINIDLVTTTTTTDESGKDTTVQGNNTMNKSVSIVPANNVYYEDTFVTNKETGVVGIEYGKGFTVSAEGSNKETPDSAIDGGWMNTDLANDTTHSDGTAAVGTNGATATFTFTGTGVDVYSYTDMQSGSVVGILYKDGFSETVYEKDADGKIRYYYSPDGYDADGKPNTYVVKNAEDIWVKADGTPVTYQQHCYPVVLRGAVAEKTLIVDNLAVSGQYYNIPTLSFQDLAYGTYVVKLIVNDEKAVVTDENGNVVTEAVFDENGNKIGEAIVYDDSNMRSTYYLDGIRVYNPLGAVTDKYTGTEQNTIFEEVRDLLADTTNNTDTSDDKVFIDLDGQGNVADKPAYDATEYGTYGPKNEVYLGAGQKVTFKVSDSTAAYYVGLKAPEGAATQATISNGAAANAVAEIVHSTDLYYKVVPTDGNITIENSGTELLSVTKIQMVTSNTSVSTVELLAITKEEAAAEFAAFSLRASAPYAEEEVVEPEVPETPEVPDIDVEIENPDPEPAPEPAPDPREGLRNLVRKLFGRIFGLF